MHDEKLPEWDGRDLMELLDLEPLGGSRFRSRFAEANEHGRTYGGQLLAHAIMVAARTVPNGRSPASLQFLFLQGAMNDRPIEYQVTALQEGKRFSARNVRGEQAGGRFVCDAQVTFALPLEAPEHTTPLVREDWAAIEPESLPRLIDLPAELGANIERVLGYQFRESTVIDLRLPDRIDDALSPAPAPRLRVWIRLRRALPSDPFLHAAAFAYLSDWWLNFTSCGSHLPDLVAAGRRLYVASLNHAIWFHRPLRADQWLHFDCVSPSAAAGRGLTIGSIHDSAGRLVASATQECLIALIEE
jgi:acyl-CoA thioesterase-2